jgi:lysozyme family protein
MNLVALKASYEKMWADCQVQPAKIHELTQVAIKLCDQQHKMAYVAVQKLTAVPWFVIGVIHEREASGAWWANIAQGDPWNRISTHVPKNRGPFRSWQDAAVDALKNCSPFMARNMDWSAGGTLIHLVQYNGLAYELHHNEWSPYIWAATNHEERGKYVTDGHYDPRAWDAQLGCAAMLKRMSELDPDVKFPGSYLPQTPVA